MTYIMLWWLLKIVVTKLCVLCFVCCSQALESQHVNERSTELFPLPLLSLSPLSHHAYMQPTSWSRYTWPSLPCWACWFSFCWFACCPAWSKWRRGPRGLLPWRSLPRTLAKRMRERLSDRLEGKLTMWRWWWWWWYCCLAIISEYYLLRIFTGGQEHHQTQRRIQAFPGRHYREVSEHWGWY